MLRHFRYLFLAYQLVYLVGYLRGLHPLNAHKESFRIFYLPIEHGLQFLNHVFAAARQVVLTAEQDSV